MDIFKISATGHTFSYLPQYVAQHFGFFKELDIQVETDVPVLWDDVLRDVNCGTHHAVCGGIWVPSIYIQHKIHEYRAFCNLSSTCGMGAVSHKPVEGPFDWKWFEDKTVLVPGYGGISAFMWLYGTLKENGVDVSRINFIRDFSLPMLTEGFEKGGWGDALYTFTPEIVRLTQSGAGYQVCNMMTQSPPVPYSVYYATPETMAKSGDLYGRFTLGIQRAMNWLAEHDAAEAGIVFEKEFPGVPLQRCVDIVREYQKGGIWKTTEFDWNATDHYGGFQVDLGLIDRKLKKEELIDESAYQYAAAHLK